MKVSDSGLIADIIEWDVSNWSRALAIWQPQLSKLDKTNAIVLCLGERNGGLSLWFALQGFRVICSDLNGPTDAARLLHKKHGVDSLVTYSKVDVFKTGFEDSSIDVVACKSVIGGLKLNYHDKLTRTLENQKRAIDEVHRILRPGGSFLVAENMRGSWLHRLARQLLKGKRIGWRHLSIGDLSWLFSDFDNVDVEFLGFVGVGSLPLLSWISKLINSAFEKVAPSSWLYIGVVQARKFPTKKLKD